MSLNQFSIDRLSSIFDNLSMQYFSGPLVEENHYYPFGLTMAGISDKAIKTQYAQNKYRYNGKELQNQEFSDGSGLEAYDYGARLQDPQIGRFLTDDPHSEKYADFSPYNYCVDNPENAVDVDGRDAILIVYLDYKINVGGMHVPYLGHAGVLLIDNKTGVTRYYEYGRYDPANKGLVRRVSVSNVKIGKDGRPTIASLNKVLGQLSKRAGEGGRIRGAYIVSDQNKEMEEYADKKEAENKDPNRKEYSLMNNNCGTFASDVVDQDEDVKKPWIVWPAPNNIVSDYVDEGNAEVDYAPEKGTTTIG